MMNGWLNREIKIRKKTENGDDNLCDDLVMHREMQVLMSQRTTSLMVVVMMMMVMIMIMIMIGYCQM